jgi:MoxR-like ATPase
MPSDITGTEVIYQDQSTGERQFKFLKGPIFANIVLADEINRTTPKTQSALLEAMNENQVTIESSTYPLPRPFMVLATQNPAEHHGTYPLPESQLDRFLMKIEVGYPDATAEKEILKRFTTASSNSAVEPVLTPADVIALQDDSRKVHIGEEIIDYMLQIVTSTRNHPEIELGVSPRGTVALFRSVQAMALVNGRSYAIPDDVKRLVPRVFGHRLLVARSGSKIRTDAQAILRRILDEANIRPRGETRRCGRVFSSRWAFSRSPWPPRSIPPLLPRPAICHPPLSRPWYRCFSRHGLEYVLFRGSHVAWTGDGCPDSRSTK